MNDKVQVRWQLIRSLDMQRCGVKLHPCCFRIRACSALEFFGLRNGLWNFPNIFLTSDNMIENRLL